MHKKEEILQILNSLEFDPEIMNKFLAIIDSVEGDTLDEETVRQMKTMLLEVEEEALDDAATVMGINLSNDPDLRAADAEYKNEVDEIRSEFQSDMKVLDEALDNLDSADRDLTQVGEGVQIAQITADIKAS